MPTVRYATLTAMAPGQQVRIRRVKDSDPDLLRYLGRLGLYPHVVIDVLAKAPFDGPLTIRASSGEHALGSQVTDSVFVEPVLAEGA
jgi:DtxR family Mn-dependent transcriptional regulator